MLLLIQLSSLFLVVIFLILSFRTFLTVKSASYFFLNLYFISAITWGVSTLLAFHTTSENLFLMYARISFFFGIFTTQNLFTFAFFFPNGKIQRRKISIIIVTNIISLYLATASALTDDTLVGGDQKRNTLQYGKLRDLITLYLFVLILGMIIVFVSKLRNKKISGITRLQLQYVLSTNILAASLSFLTNAFLPYITKNSNTSSLGIVTALVGGIGIIYATQKYRFFSVRFVVGKILNAIILGLLLVIIFLFISFIQIKLWKDVFRIESIILGFLFALIFIYLYNKIKIKIDDFIDINFTNPQFTPEDVIKKLQRKVESAQNINIIINETLITILKTSHTQRAGIILFDSQIVQFINKKKNKYTVKIQEETLKKLELHLKRTRQLEPLISEEFNLQIASKKRVKNASLKWIILLMKRRNINVLIPLYRNKKLRGILLLGPKTDRNAYTIHDIDFLQMLAKTVVTYLTKFIVTINDVSMALRDLTKPDKLSSSKLINLPSIKNITKTIKISPTFALQDTLTNSIESFNPKINSGKRTASILRFEILRMIAYEEATESQIMWDLGFDVYNRSVMEKLSKHREPRFKLRDASEYSATSMRSYKRLKKEAIEMLKWKLEEGELKE